MRAVLFDCDGTIADSCGFICEVMARAFKAHGLPVPPDEATRSIIGLSLGTAIARLHPAADSAMVERLVEGYRSEFRRARTEPGFSEVLFPGMRELVADLHSRDDVLVGLVTGKSRRGVEAICAAHDMRHMFQAVRTADDCPSKPHPAMVLECCGDLGVLPHETLVIGDSIYDIEMARAAGAAALGVAWGTHGPQALLAAGSFAVADTVKALSGHVDAWLERRVSDGAEARTRAVPAET